MASEQRFRGEKPLRLFTRLRASWLSRAVAVDDTPLRKVVRRDFDIHSIARKNLDAMPAQTACDVRENGVSVIEFDGKRRARKDLLDSPEHLERLFFGVLRNFRRPLLTVVLFALASPMIRYRRYSLPGLS